MMNKFVTKKINSSRSVFNIWDAHKSTEEIISRGSFNIKTLLYFVSFFGIFVYMFFQVLNIFKPPYIEIVSPVNGSVVEENIINIQGITLPETTVYLNKKMLFIDREGRFSEKVILTPGANILQLKAKKKYSKENIVKINIYYNDKNSPLAKN